MPERKDAVVHIGQLNLRIPGTDAATGHRVADGITESIARQVPIAMRRRLGAIGLRLEVPAEASEAQISDAIAERIINALQK